MDKRQGEVYLSGTLSYVPQQAWLQNMSLKENIIFGAPFMQETYEKIIEACALKADIAMLPAGDETEIGEKGINLSGGQKQRISLARAIYADADIILLDDPLSAVDVHVGKHIFEKIISSKSGLLAKKTRILVTHSLHYLKFCDQIIVMKDGTISECGTYEELICGEGAFSKFLEEYLAEEVESRGRSVSFGEQEEEVSEVLKDLEKFHPGKWRNVESHISQESLEQRSISNKGSFSISALSDDAKSGVVRKSDGGNKFEIEPLIKKSKVAAPSNDEKSKLIEKETVEVGRVKWSVYMAYIKAIGYPTGCLFVIIYVLSSILGVFSNLWLAHWSDHAKQCNSSSGEDDTNMRLGVYAGLGIGQAAFICAASAIMALGMVYASRILHEGILSNILHSPMAFFDVTPLGRILNRFGKVLNFDFITCCYLKRKTTGLIF
uniref:ABC transmembrane type-1 domain-containing protein n=1 Tax=Syphacia muris TaxID=451379 RepID=A0A0N5ACE9_9BILA